MNSSATKTTVPARGNLHGMAVQFKGDNPDAVTWEVLDRHPTRAHWWLHRRDDMGVWVTTFARYSQLVQVVE